MVDALALGASLARGGGSSPLLGTVVEKRAQALFSFTTETQERTRSSEAGTLAETRSVARSLAQGRRELALLALSILRA